MGCAGVVTAVDSSGRSRPDQPSDLGAGQRSRRNVEEAQSIGWSVGGAALGVGDGGGIGKKAIAFVLAGGTGVAWVL
jgi:hypothetical protein